MSGNAHDGSPRKGDRTRTAILDAAREQFGRHGFDRTNIRSIAAQARIDPSMVMRYFGNKEALFAEAVSVDLALPDLRSGPASALGQRLVEHFLTRWEGDSSDVLVVLLRSSASHDGAAARMREIFASQLVSALRQVLPADQCERRAALVSAQMLGLALGRYILKLPSLVDRSAGGLVNDIGPTVQRYLTGDLDTGA